MWKLASERDGSSRSALQLGRVESDQMKLSELAARIGQVGYLRSEAFRVPVRILDGKSSYGEPRYLVTPEGGEGEAWVNATRITFR